MEKGSANYNRPLPASSVTENSQIAANLSSRALATEQALLVAFAFVLPLYEAPKNLLWIALVVAWIVNRIRARDFGGPWDRWDSLIATWIASGYVVAIFAGIHHYEVAGAHDILRYGSVLWILKRSRYPDGAWRALAIAIVAGTFVTLAWGYWGVLVTHKHEYLGLHSVGHVNHSAIYLSIVFGLALAATRAWWHQTNRGRRILGIAVLALCIVSIFWMQSRAAIGASFAAALLVLGVYSWRLQHGFRMIAIGAVVAVAAVLLLKPEALEKNEAFIKQDIFLSHRGGVWRVGLAAWREYPIFGVGMDNFGRISYDKLEAWSKKRGEPFEKSRYALASHGHSLFVNTLTERGLFGLAVLLAVLAAWAWALARAIPEATAPPLVWTYWGGAAFAWTLAVVVGTVNTTLHHEHALLSMLLLGGWLSIERARRGAPA